MPRTITIGADPELFAFRGETPVSVHDLLPGTKHNPCKVGLGAIQVDGVAAEFNIQPAKTQREFVRNIQMTSGILEKILKKKDPSLRLVAAPTVHFSKKYFSSLPAKALALGCEPDYSAYTEKPNVKPETTKPMRTGSGHVHVGWSDCNQEDPAYKSNVLDIVKELDFCLHIQSLNWDADKERQDLYGMPGSFRFKPYGLEYRTLSNAWLRERGLIEFVYDATKAAVARYFAKHTPLNIAFKTSEDSYENFLQKKKFPLVRDYRYAS